MALAVLKHFVLPDPGPAWTRYCSVMETRSSDLDRDGYQLAPGPSQV